MAIIYVDYENGNDSNDGTTFANRKKTLTSASGAASAGDTIRVAKSPDPTSLGNGTISDPHPSFYSTKTISTITYSNVTGATDITVSNHGMQTGDIVEIFDNTNSYNINGVYEVTRVDSSSLTLNNYNAGVNASGSGGKIRPISGKCIKLASAPVKNIASFAGGTQRTAWVASANVTTSLYSQYGSYTSTKSTMQGGYSDQIVISSSFTTGKAAYYTLPSTLDLSGYQQLSLHIHQYSGTKVAAGNYSLRLCSDTTGDTTVNTFTIPQPGGTSGNSADLFIPITVDLGTNLGSNIQSIALYVDSDSGGQNIRMCNIIACKAKSSADSLTLNSLVSRDGTSDDQKLWYTVEAIEGDGDIIVVGPTGRTNYQKVSNVYASQHAWFGDTGGTYTFYKRECFNTSVDNNATGATTVVQQIQKSGTSGNKITISGGWDTSDSMATQNGESFYDGNSHNDGRGFYISSRDYISIENLGFFRYYEGFYIDSCDHMSVKNCFAGLCQNRCFRMRTNDYMEDLEIYMTGGGTSYPLEFYYHDYPKPKSDGPYVRKIYLAGSYQGMQIGYNGTGGTWEFDDIWVLGCMQYTYITGNYGPVTIDNFTIPEGNGYSSGGGIPRVNGNYAKVLINTLSTKNTYYGGFYAYQEQYLDIGTLNVTNETSYWDPTWVTYGCRVSNSKVIVRGGSIDRYPYLDSGTELFTDNLTINFSTEYFITSGGKLYGRNYDGVSGNYTNASQYAKLESDTTTRRTASGFSWKATMTSSSATYNSGYTWDIAKVAVQANSEVTASVYVNRTGTGIHGGLKIDSGQLAGLASTESYCMGSAGSWEQVTVSGTPTEDGIITIKADAYYDGNTSDVAYFDDFSVTQA